MTVAPITEEPIFDASGYDLPIPRLDGHKADRLSIAFSGGVDLDRTSEEDLSMVDSLTLGREIELRVTAIVMKKGFTLSAGKDEEPEKTGYGIGLKVQSIEVV